ncbi:uncharacterized protein LJ264_016541 [Porphyrio hochstetteri]
MVSPRRPPPTGASPAAASSSSSSPPPRSSPPKAISAGAPARWHRVRRVRGGCPRRPRSGRGALPSGGGASPSGRCCGGRDGRRSSPGPRSFFPHRRSPGQGSPSGLPAIGSRQSPGGTAEKSRRRVREPAAGERRGACAWRRPRFAAGATLLGGLRCGGGEPRTGRRSKPFRSHRRPRSSGGCPPRRGTGSGGTGSGAAQALRGGPGGAGRPAHSRPAPPAGARRATTRSSHILAGRRSQAAAGRRGLLVSAAGQTSPSFGRAAGRSACRAAPPSPAAARSDAGVIDFPSRVVGASGKAPGLNSDRGRGRRESGLRVPSRRYEQGENQTPTSPWLCSRTPRSRGGRRRPGVATEPREALKADTWVSPRLAAPAQMDAPHHELSPRGPVRGYGRAKAAAAAGTRWAASRDRGRTQTAGQGAGTPGSRSPRKPRGEGLWATAAGVGTGFGEVPYGECFTICPPVLRGQQNHRLAGPRSVA